MTKSAYEFLSDWSSSSDQQAVIKSLDEYQKEFSQLTENDESYQAKMQLLRDTLSLSPTLEPVIRLLEHLTNVTGQSNAERNSSNQHEPVVWRFLTQAFRWGRAAGCLPALRSVAKVLIANHIRPVYRNISSTGTLCTVTLQYLAELSNFCAPVTRDLWQSFNFTHRSLPGLLAASRKNGNNYQRGLFIRFLLGFLRYGDSQSKRELLEMKMISGGLIKYIPDDSPATVSILLDVIYKNVVCDSELPHSLKLALLNSNNLEFLVRLYRRPEMDVRSACQEFLCQICCRPGHGVCFQSDGWFTTLPSVSASNGMDSAGTNGRNKILLQLLLQLRPLDCELQSELFLSICKAAPEVVHQFWRTLAASGSGAGASVISLQQTTTTTTTTAGWQFEPHADGNQRWLDTMNFTLEIIRLPIPRLKQSVDNVTANAAARDDAQNVAVVLPARSIVVDNIIPAPLTKSLLSKLFQSQNSTVQYATAVVFLAALDKLYCIHEVISRYDSSSDWWSALILAIRKRIPDFQLILALFNRLSSVRESSSDSAMAVDQEDNAVDKSTAEDVEQELLSIAILRIIKRYLALFPEVVVEEKFDFGRLLRMLRNQFTATNQQLLELSIMEIIYSVATQFQWHKTLNEGEEQQCYIIHILRLAKSTVDQAVRRFIYDRLLPRLLQSTNAYELAPHEVYVWLASFEHFQSEHHQTQLFDIGSQIFCECLLELRSRPAHFIRLYDSVVCEFLPVKEITRIPLSPLELANTDLVSFYQARITKELPGSSPSAASQLVEIPFSLLIVAALDKWKHWNRLKPAHQAEAAYKFLSFTFQAVVRQTQVQPGLLMDLLKRNSFSIDWPDVVYDETLIPLTAPCAAMRRLNSLLIDLECSVSSHSPSTLETLQRIFELFERISGDNPGQHRSTIAALIMLLKHPLIDDRLESLPIGTQQSLCKILESVVERLPREQIDQIRKVCSVICGRLLFALPDLDKSVLALLVDPMDLIHDSLDGDDEKAAHLCRLLSLLPTTRMQYVDIPLEIITQIMRSINRRLKSGWSSENLFMALTLLFGKGLVSSWETSSAAERQKTLESIGIMITSKHFDIHKRLQLTVSLPGEFLLKTDVLHALLDEIDKTAAAGKYTNLQIRQTVQLLTRVWPIPVGLLQRILKHIMQPSNANVLDDLDLIADLCQLIDYIPSVQQLELPSEEHLGALPLNSLTFRLAAQMSPEFQWGLICRGLEQVSVLLEERGPLREDQLKSDARNTANVDSPLLRDLADFLLQSTTNQLNSNSPGFDAKLIKRFIIACLKYGLADPQAIKLCSALISEGLYERCEPSPPFALATLFQMCLGHSKFNICAQVRDEPEIRSKMINSGNHIYRFVDLDNPAAQCPLPVWSWSHERRRTSLFQLLQTIAEKSGGDENLFNSAHIPLLLSFYSSSRRQSDQVIEQLLVLIEQKTGMSVLETVMRSNHWTANISRQVSEMDGAIANPVFSVDCVDSRWMLASALLPPQTDRDCYEASDSEMEASYRLLYSQRFWLSAIAHWLLSAVSAAESDVLSRLVDSNCLALALRGLSSGGDNSTIRTTAYTIVNRAYEALLAGMQFQLDGAVDENYYDAEEGEEEEMSIDDDDTDAAKDVGHSNRLQTQSSLAQLGKSVKEKRQVFLLLHCLSYGTASMRKSSPTLSSPNIPVIMPSIITAFAVQALQVIARPDSDLYPLINRFLLQRPLINLQDIPMLYDMFNSTDDRIARRCRTWIVRLILYGLQGDNISDEDLKMIKRRHILPLLYSAYYEPTMDRQFRILITEVLAAAAGRLARLKDGWRALSRSGLFPFWSQLLSTPTTESLRDDFVAKAVLNGIKNCVFNLSVNVEEITPPSSNSIERDDEDEAIAKDDDSRSDNDSSISSDSSDSNSDSSDSSSEESDDSNAEAVMSITAARTMTAQESFYFQLIALIKALASGDHRELCAQLNQIINHSVRLIDSLKADNNRSSYLINMLLQLGNSIIHQKNDKLNFDPR